VEGKGELSLLQAVDQIFAIRPCFLVTNEL
jgi:hypothetical protein